NCLFQRFVLTAPDIFQIFTIRACCCRFVKIDRDVQLVAHPFAQFTSEQHAVIKVNPFDGDKWDDIGGTETWMLTSMFVHINQAGGCGNPLKSGFYDGIWRGDEGDNGTIVIGVVFTIKNMNLRHRADCLNNLVYDGCASSFREIGNALYDLSHNGVHLRGDKTVRRRLKRTYCNPESRGCYNCPQYPVVLAESASREQKTAGLLLSPLMVLREEFPAMPILPNTTRYRLLPRIW